MNHYSGFDPYVIKERNEEIRREVRALRLERFSERVNPRWVEVTGIRHILLKPVA